MGSSVSEHSSTERVVSLDLGEVDEPDRTGVPEQVEYIMPRYNRARRSARSRSARSRKSYIGAGRTMDYDSISYRSITNPRESQRHRYHIDTFGLYACAPYDFRDKSRQLRVDGPVLPEVAPCNMPTVRPFIDHYFGPTIAIPGTYIEWKRPSEFCEEPVLMSSKRSPLTLGHDPIGIDWFIYIMAILRDKPNLFHRIMPEDAWDRTEGTFYCHFWRFGKWETLYTDDFLPVNGENELWGAKSMKDKNEMWPALLEKTFARLYGNYNAIHGRYCGDAFQTLTGGCAEYIDFGRTAEDRESKMPKKVLRDILERLKNACRQSNCTIFTELSSDGLGGFQSKLFTHRAYVITAIQSEISKDKLTNQVKLEDHCPEVKVREDGEPESETEEMDTELENSEDTRAVWIAFEDLIEHCSGVTICSTMPNSVRDDGSNQYLRFCTPIFGEWYMDSAAGFNDRINNPKFVFRVSSEGEDEEGKVQVLVQICQKLKDMKLIQPSIRVDLYKVLGEEMEVEKVCAVKLLGDNTNVYYNAMQISTRFRVEPGCYLVIPSTYESGKEKEFLVRIFTPGPIYDVREIGSEYSIYEFDEFIPEDDTYSHPSHIEFSQTVLLKWKIGKKVAIETDHDRTEYRYPRIDFDVPNVDNGKEQLVTFTLIEEIHSCPFPLELRVFQIERDQKNSDCSECGYHRPIQQDADDMSIHVFRPGKYCILLILGEPVTGKFFSLNISATCNLNTRIQDMCNWGSEVEGIISINNARSDTVNEVGGGILQVTAEGEEEYENVVHRKITPRERERAELMSLDSYSEYMREAQATSRAKRELFETQKLYFQLKIQRRYNYLAEKRDSEH